MNSRAQIVAFAGILSLFTVGIPRMAVGAGEIVGWGMNDYGQCNPPVPNLAYVAVSAGNHHSLGLLSDGSVTAWGGNPWGQCDVPNPNSGFAAIAAGGDFSLGLKTDTSIVAWGDNHFGELAVPSPNAGFVAIAAGGAHAIALRSSGSIVGWGDNRFGQAVPPAGSELFTAVAAGLYHSLALSSDGSVVAWGDNSWGQCTVPPPNSNFVGISAGWGHSLGLKADGSIVAWGRNDFGQCDVPQVYGPFARVAGGGYHSLGLRSSGLIAAWGLNDLDQCDVPSPNSGFVAIAAGLQHNLAVRLGAAGMRVDFGGSEPQAGFDLFPSGPANEPRYFQSSIGIGGTVSVHLSTPATCFLDWRARLPVESGPYEPLSLLLSNFAFAMGTPPLLTVNLTRVLPGRYQFRSYHHDTEFGDHGLLTVVVHDAAGTRVVAEEVPQSTGTSPGSICIVQFNVLADGVTPLAIDYQVVGNTGNAAICNGFELTGTPEWRATLRDQPGDEGGVLQLIWPRHPFENSEGTPIIVSYEIQRMAQDWQSVRSIEAAAADSYVVLVDTPAVLTIGQQVPSEICRVVALTSTPTLFFESPPDTAYSIDNLPPDPPTLSLYDSETYRSLSWVNPSAPDFGTGCLYRGSEPNFEAGEPLLCSPTQYWYQETDLNRYWYRARSFDIHGNASEWSNEVVGRYPTGVPGMPTVLRLYPNQPNPFNPMTTIRFDIPAAGRVRFEVYDARGKLIRSVVDADLAPGSHQAVWDGRDAAGRALASGSYFARLSFGGKVETVRMGLVR